MNYVNINNSLVPAVNPQLFHNNKAYRYGDGLFETMKATNGEIALFNYHINRLQAGIKQLKYIMPTYFSETWLADTITQVCIANNHTNMARVRLSLYRGDGDLQTNTEAGIIIETYELQETQLQHPLTIGVYNEGCKNCDSFSNLKTANALLYSMAAIYAGEQQWQDCIILNNHRRVAETTIANIFWIKKGIVFTPPLSEGFVAGVMRQYILDNTAVTLQICTLDDLLTADEIFLTNAIRGIRPVTVFEHKNYVSSLGLQLAATLL